MTVLKEVGVDIVKVTPAMLTFAFLEVGNYNAVGLASNFIFKRFDARLGAKVLFLALFVLA